MVCVRSGGRAKWGRPRMNRAETLTEDTQDTGQGVQRSAFVEKKSEGVGTEAGMEADLSSALEAEAKGS